MKSKAKSTQAQPAVLSVREAAIMLCLGKVTVYKAVKDGTLPSIRVGKKIGIPIRSIERMLGDARV